MKRCDILIIGAGAVGCAIARELTKYHLRVAVVEKSGDVGGDASKSNSAIIHTGYDAAPGTLESQLVVAANPMYDRLCQELDIPFQRVGALLPAVTKEQYDQLPAILEKAFQNRVYDVEYLPAKAMLEREPSLNPQVMGGLYIPREAIIDPFIQVVALAENAVQNGAEVLLNAEVTGLCVKAGRVCGVETTQGDIEAGWVINAAGLHGDEIAAMAGKADYRVNPRKGQFYILDSRTACRVAHIVLPIPTKQTKGKLMCPTVHGNMLIGPTAEDLEDKDDHATTAEGLQSVVADVRRLVPEVRIQDSITQYSGLRPNRTPEGVYIDTYPDLAGYLNISGVRSTGLTASVSIAKYVRQKLADAGLGAPLRDDFEPVRRGIVRMAGLPAAEQARRIAANPLYGRVVCRCETVTEGEIVEAIHGIVPARSIDAVKRRLRAGLGRCQGGFCGPKVVQILARELGCTPEEVLKNEPGSAPVVGAVRKEAACV